MRKGGKLLTSGVVRSIALLISGVAVMSGMMTVSKVWATEEIVRGIAMDPVGPIVRGLPGPMGPKKTIVVRDFENVSGWRGRINLGEGMAEQLITALHGSGYFRVIEREHISDILTEQDFQVSGRAARGTEVAQIGKVLSPQIEIKGVVTEFTMDESSRDTGMRIEGFEIGGGKTTARVAVDIRIYDTTTGQILASETCDAIASASSGGVAYHSRDFSFAHEGSRKMPLGVATRQAINRAVQFIMGELGRMPWEGRIVSVRENTYYLNCGQESGVMPGDQFNVYLKGEDIIDEATGENLGAEKSLVGRVEIAKVEKKFSKAVEVKGSGFPKGSIIRFE